MNINDLYSNAVSGNRLFESRLFEYLSVSFRIFAQQRIRNEQDVEEIVQDTLMTIANKYKDIDFETSFAAWSYKVLNNKMLDYFKAQRVRSKARSIMSAEENPGGAWKPDPTLKRRLRKCLKMIGDANSQHARVLNLHYQGYTTAEICERLGIKKGHLHVMLSRARSMLETCLAKGDIR
jgi:RNA polymerase sigma-70 factor (ECF subfamily)